MPDVTFHAIAAYLLISLLGVLLSKVQLITNSSFMVIKTNWRSYWIAALKRIIMKKTINAHCIKTLFAAILVFLVNVAVQAQEKVTTVTHTETQTTSWIGDHWMWVAGGVLLLIILIALGSSGSRRTTVTRDNITGTTTSTTVEE